MINNKKLLILFLLVLVNIFLFFYNNIENFENTEIVDMIKTNTGLFKQVFSKITNDEINTNKNIVTSKNINAKNANIIDKITVPTISGTTISGSTIKSTNDINGKNLNITEYIKIGNTNLNSDFLKRLYSWTKLGCITIDGEGSTHILSEGKNTFRNNGLYDAWTDNRIDVIFLLKGWKITLYDGSDYKGRQYTIENKTNDIKRVNLDATELKKNKASSYYLRWVGY